MTQREEDARLQWRGAQAELELALDALETGVAEAADGTTHEAARSVATTRQAGADNLLQRYITRIGKSEEP